MTDQKRLVLDARKSRKSGGGKAGREKRETQDRQTGGAKSTPIDGPHILCLTSAEVRRIEPVAANDAKTLKPAPRDRLRFLPSKEQGEFLLQFYRHVYPRAMSSSGVHRGNRQPLY